MNTILNFTFFHGIELFIAALLLSFIVIYICYWIGARQQRKDYEKEYKYLKLFVDNYNISKRASINKKAREHIEKQFDKLSKYPCRNYEKLQVLERTFIKKFK